jgi:hypothetical protein
MYVARYAVRISALISGNAAGELELVHVAGLWSLTIFTHQTEVRDIILCVSSANTGSSSFQSVWTSMPVKICMSLELIERVQGCVLPKEFV